jgi:hypothetical protein
MTNTISKNSATIHFESREELLRMATACLRVHGRSTDADFPGTSMQVLHGKRTPWISLPVRNGRKVSAE